MRCLIILNGSCKNTDYLKKLSLQHNYIICADGGYKYAKAAGITPDIVLGDFDSCEKPDCVDVIQYPAEKDLTDCEIAVEHALSKGFRNITLTCALGGRVDHQLANIMLCLAYYDRADIVIEEDDCILIPLFKTQKLSDYIGKTFSIIPVEQCEVSISGVYYPLSGKRINPGDTLTVSNIINNINAVVSLEYGKAILVINKNI